MLLFIIYFVGTIPRDMLKNGVLKVSKSSTENFKNLLNKITDQIPNWMSEVNLERFFFSSTVFYYFRFVV